MQIISMHNIGLAFPVGRTISDSLNASFKKKKGFRFLVTLNKHIGHIDIADGSRLLSNKSMGHLIDRKEDNVVAAEAYMVASLLWFKRTKGTWADKLVSAWPCDVESTPTGVKPNPSMSF